MAPKQVKHTIEKKPSGSPAVLKKPASKATVRNIAMSLLNVDPEDDDYVRKRDRNKLHQWNKYMDTLPEAIKQAYNKAGRSSKTSMVNQLVKKLPDGGYTIDTANHIYVDTMKKYDLRYGEHGVQGMIRAHMVVKCGGEEHLT